MGFCDLSFTSLNVVFSSFFIICYNCVTKIDWSPIPCHKRSSATKTYFFIINLMTIILLSLNYDTNFSSLKIYKNITKSCTQMMWQWRGADMAAFLWQILVRHKIFYSLFFSPYMITAIKQIQAQAIFSRPIFIAIDHF